MVGSISMRAKKIKGKIFKKWNLLQLRDGPIISGQFYFPSKTKVLELKLVHFSHFY